MKNYLYFLALSLLFGACKKYQTQYDGPYEDPKDGSSTTGKPTTYEIWYALDGKLYAASPDFRLQKQVAVPEYVQFCAVNYAHDRIAYKAAANIIIIDSSGTNPVTVPNSSSVKWFDWHSNNQTLYMLKTDNKLYQYGGTNVTLSVTNLATGLPFGGGTDLEIPAAAVLPDGGVITCFSIYTGLGYSKGFYLNYPAGSPNVDRYINTQYDTPQTIRISQDGNRIVYTTFNGSFYDSFEYEISTGGSAYIMPFNIRQAATSPDGTKTACWDLYTGQMFERLLSNIILPVNGTCTALDW